MSIAISLMSAKSLSRSYGSEIVETSSTSSTSACCS